MVTDLRELEIDRIVVSNLIVDRNCVDDSGDGFLVVH